VFFKEFVGRRLPVILTGAMRDWPALAKWNSEYMKEILRPERPLDIFFCDRGQSFTASADEVFSALASRSPSSRAYYISVGCIKVGPRNRRFQKAQYAELERDIVVPDLVPRDALFEMNFWAGTHGVVTNLHYDFAENLLAIVRGRKDIVLFAPDQTSFLYAARPLDFGTLPFQSMVDLAFPRLERFPKLVRAKYHRFYLEEGEILFLPSGFWHYIRSEGAHMAVNIWFDEARFFKRLRPQHLRTMCNELIRRAAGPLRTAG
jgi:hypothetical protein